MEHQQQHNSGCLNTAGVITLWMRARFTKCSELQRITAPQQVRLIMACDNAGASYANGMYHQISKFICVLLVLTVCTLHHSTEIVMQLG